MADQSHLNWLLNWSILSTQILNLMSDISEASDKGKIYNPAGMKRLEELQNAKLLASASSSEPETKKPVIGSMLQTAACLLLWITDGWPKLCLVSWNLPIGLYRLTVTLYTEIELTKIKSRISLKRSKKSKRRGKVI